MKEKDVLPPLPPLKDKKTLADLLGTPLDSPNPLGEKVSAKFATGGFISTPSMTDITGLRSANDQLREEVAALSKRLEEVEGTLHELVKQWIRRPY